MINEYLDITNLHSKKQNKLFVDLLYDTKTNEAHRECVLYYDTYENCCTIIMHDPLSPFNQPDSIKLIRPPDSTCPQSHYSSNFYSTRFNLAKANFQ